SQVGSQVAAHAALHSAIPQAPVVDGAVGAVLLDGVRRGKASDGDVILVVALVLGSLQLAGQSGGVVADDQVNVGVRAQHSLANGDGLLGILVGVVVVRGNVRPVGIFLSNDGLAGNLPGVLVRHSGLRIVPAVGNLVILGVHAAGLKAGNSHVHQHLAQHVGRALGNHQVAVFRQSVRVPCGNDDAGIGSSLQRVGNASGVNGGDADGVRAGGNGRVDNLHLVGHGGGGAALVVHSD